MTEDQKPLTDSEFEESIGVLKKRKEHLQERVESLKFKPGWFILVIIAGGLAGYSFAAITNFRHYENLTQIIDRRLSYVVIGALFGTFMYGYVFSFFRISAQNRLRRIEYKLVQLGAEELQDKIEENFFTKLVKINFKYLDQYYLQTQEQADKSFRLASNASITGLVIISIGIIMMFFDKTEPAYVTTAAGVLSEFIAAVFFYLYNRTVLKMSQYHQKLVITQNISLALKISEDMETENKAKVQEMIIDRLTADINKYLSTPE
jgi:uncharacterized membrane protein